MSRAQFDLPETRVSKDVIERIQFSVSSRNAGSKVSECFTHVFVSPYADDPSTISWQYVSSGVTCLLRKKEVAKSGRKLVWAVQLCLYNVAYGVLVWKGVVTPNSCYTAVTDTFHVFVVQELNAIVGLLFDESSQAKEFLRSYLQWEAEKTKEERSKGGGSGSSSPAQFRKEMISKPCNFQHIQGTQALDECMEIEKIKTDIQATFFGIGSAQARRSVETKSAGGKRKKDAGRPRIQFQNISVPHRASGTKRHIAVETCKSLDVDVISGQRPAPLFAQESLPADMLRNSMPPQHPVSLVHHQSQPDLLDNRRAGDASPPAQPMSPQYDSLPRDHNSSSEGYSPTGESSLDNHRRLRPQTVPVDPTYDTLHQFTNGKEPSSPATRTPGSVPLQNGSDHVAPNSPVYDGLIRAESPLYDSLQKNTKHELTEADRRYQPQLYVDAIVDDEVAGYSILEEKGGRGNAAAAQDYTPPPRLSPLSFEKEFSQSAFFRPAFVTSTTNC